MCKVLRKKAKKRAKVILIDIFMNKRMTLMFSSYLIRYIKTINMIAKRWREFKKKKDNFQSLLGHLFDKYFSKVLETISKSTTENEDFSSQILNARRIEKLKTE